MVAQKELTLGQKLLLKKILSTCPQRKQVPPKKKGLTLYEVLKKKGHGGK